MIFFSSPNYDLRPKGIEIDTIVIHHTEMSSLSLAVSRLCDENSRVSSHYIICKTGKIIQLVKDEYRAWHAGMSFWRNKKQVNDFSIGIELDNNGHEPFPSPQMLCLIKLCLHLIASYPIVKRNIIGHSDIAPARKADPSHLFDWGYLAENGIGLFPRKKGSNTVLYKYQDKSANFADVQYKLRAYGYDIKITSEFDDQSKDVVLAFKRHFCRESYLLGTQDVWDEDSNTKLEELTAEI